MGEEEGRNRSRKGQDGGGRGGIEYGLGKGG
jgi:hypothetical protein